MMSTGFSWGVMPSGDRHAGHLHEGDKDMTQRNLLSAKSAVAVVSATGHVGELRRKRRLSDLELGKVHKPSMTRKSYPSMGAMSKRSRTPKISGQKLPFNRLIEVLDRKSLQSILTALVLEFPEVSGFLAAASPKPTLADHVELVKDKFTQIFKHLPYKCDVESDYSYLRVKPYLRECFSCLSDHILNFLPPVEQNIHNSVFFLHEVTLLIHNLPNFSNTEFQYTKLMAYEQLANTWLIALSHNLHIDDSGSSTVAHSEPSSTMSSPSPVSQFKGDGLAEFLRIVNELNLVEKLANHDELSCGKFKVVSDFVKSEIDNCEVFNHTLNVNAVGALGDLITVDYSNYSISARTSH